MATDETKIANRALIKLGAALIVSLDENRKEAKTMNANFDSVRDAELRKGFWKFAKKRTTLAPNDPAPAFQWTYAYLLPSDFIRMYEAGEDPMGDIDYEIEGNRLLTNEGPIFYLKYVARIEDASQFDPLFAEMMSCRLAREGCEALTQSNTKFAKLDEDYKQARLDALMTGAMEEPSKELQPEDPWLVARC